MDRVGCWDHVCCMFYLQVPCDFVLEGILTTGEQVGLELISGYLVRVLTMFGSHYGAVQPRGRLYLLVVHTTYHFLMDRRFATMSTYHDTYSCCLRLFVLLLSVCAAVTLYQDCGCSCVTRILWCT